MHAGCGEGMRKMCADLNDTLLTSHIVPLLTPEQPYRILVTHYTESSPVTNDHSHKIIMGWGVRAWPPRCVREGLAKLPVDWFSLLGFAAIEFMAYG